MLFADVLKEMAGNHKCSLKYRRKGWHKQNYIFVEFRTSKDGTLEPHVLFRYGDGTAAKYYPDGNDLFADDWETVENDGDEIAEALNQIKESIPHTVSISDLIKLLDRYFIKD